MIRKLAEHFRMSMKELIDWYPSMPAWLEDEAWLIIGIETDLAAPKDDADS